MPDDPRFGEDPKPFYLAFGLLFVLEFCRRAFLGYVPDDFTAYLTAADVFASGGDPYTDVIFDAPRYHGKPYNYFPGTLYLVYPLSWLSTAAAAALDWLVRGAALVLAVRWMHRRIVPGEKFQFVLVLAVFHEPLMIDLLFGNFVTYLLAAWAACVWVAEAPPSPSRLVLAFVAGVVLAFKPFWFLPAGFAFIVTRRWSGLAGALAGGGLIVALSLTLGDTLPNFLDHTATMRDYYYSVDFLNLAPPLLVVAAAAWTAGAVCLLRRGPREWIWIWGCASLPVWPRLATYSYVMTIPILLFLIRRWGWGKALVWGAVLVGPIPWLLRVAPWMPGERLENWVHFVWSLVTAVVVFVILHRMGDDARTEVA